MFVCSCRGCLCRCFVLVLMFVSVFVCCVFETVLLFV